VDVDFSPDRQQTFMYESDGGNEVCGSSTQGRCLVAERNPRRLRAAGAHAGRVHIPAHDGIDSKGNLYVGETIGGRRVQKSINCGADGDDGQAAATPHPHGCRGNNDDDH